MNTNQIIKNFQNEIKILEKDIADLDKILDSEKFGSEGYCDSLSDKAYMEGQLDLYDSLINKLEGK